MRVITPDPLLPVSGGMGKPNPAREKRGDITARAIVFRKGDVSVAVVSLDLIGFPSVLGDRVRAKVSRIPADHILIGSTHTHSAPDCYAFPDGKGGHTGDLKYMDFVCDKAAEAVNEAIDRLQPAWIKIATGEAQGKIAYNYYAPDLYDRRMSVIQAVSPEGKTIATLVNYAVHPEVLGNDVGILSPDLVGPLCEKIESHSRRHGPVHERCPGGHGHGRQPRPEPAERPAARLLERFTLMGGMPADRPPDGRGSAAHRQGRPRAERPDALLRLDQRALSGRFDADVGRRSSAHRSSIRTMTTSRSTRESIWSTSAMPRS